MVNKNREIKAVFFDIDNTLYHFSELNRQGLEAVANYVKQYLAILPEQLEEALEQAKQRIETRLGVNSPAIHNRQIRFQNTLEILKKPIYPYGTQMYTIYWNYILDQAVPEEGLIELLEQLKKRKLYLGVGSDMTSYIQNEKLKRLGIANYFESVVTSEEAGTDKPDPKLFKLCIEKSGYKPEECLYIGDNWEKDILGARNAGMQTIYYNRYSAQKKIEADQEGLAISSYWDLYRRYFGENISLYCER